MPSDWATPETIEELKPTETSEQLAGGSKAIAAHASGDLVLFGGDDGQVCVYSTSQGKLVENFAVRGPVTDALWAGNVAVVATSAGTVEGYESGAKAFAFSAHSGGITAIALHPCGEILASVGTDKTFTFYDLASPSQALRIATNTGETSFFNFKSEFLTLLLALRTAQFHPDGHLFATGGSDGQIKVFDVKTGANAANFDESGALQAVSFSENGTWLAAAVEGSSSISIWDLRKSAQIKAIDTGGPVLGLHWDYTGQFLATAGPTGITVQQYSKSSKEWSEPLRSATAAVALDWGNKARELLTLSGEGTVTIFGAV